MKRREFLKAGSAALATTGLAACGGGDSPAPETTTPANTDPTTPTVPAKPPVEPDPVGSPTPTSAIKKTFYITDGTIRQIDGVDVYFRGFSATDTELNVPGESLIIRENDSVEITVINTLTTTHNFTIENINKVGNKNETVSVDIKPNTGEIVAFIAGTPGTYMYYDNTNNEPYNRLLGLHGALAILPLDSDNELYKASKTFKKQLFWIFNDIDPVWHNAIKANLKPNTTFEPRYFTLNGLGGRPPRAPGSMDPTQDSMADPRSKLDGNIGDRTLIRCINTGMARHSVHIHANHMEWLTTDGKARPTVWEKDIVPLNPNGGQVDVIFPFDPPPDSVHKFDESTIIAARDANPRREILYPMHLHDEMTQTAGGAAYMFGAMTDVHYLPKKV